MMLRRRRAVELAEKIVRHGPTRLGSGPRPGPPIPPQRRQRDAPPFGLRPVSDRTRQCAMRVQTGPAAARRPESPSERRCGRSVPAPSARTKQGANRMTGVVTRDSARHRPIASFGRMRVTFLQHNSSACPPQTAEGPVDFGIRSRVLALRSETNSRSQSRRTLFPKTASFHRISTETPNETTRHTDVPFPKNATQIPNETNRASTPGHSLIPY